MLDKNYFSKDIFDFLGLLKKWDVKYIIVGGEAVIYYGHARLTGDIDIFYDLKGENLSKIWQVLLEFWDNNIPGIENMEELQKVGAIVQFGLPPNRIDLLNMIDGISFEEAWINRKIEKICLDDSQTVEINLIGINELIKNKEKSGRAKDLDDLQFLKNLS